PASLRTIARTDGASVLRDVGRPDEALTMLQGVTAANGASSTQVAWAQWTRASIMRSASNGAWVDEARAVVANYPSTTYARTALNALNQAGVAVPPLQAALVRYRHGEDTSARTIYTQV